MDSNSLETYHTRTRTHAHKKTSIHIYKTCNQKKEEYIEWLERVSHGGRASQSGNSADEHLAHNLWIWLLNGMAKYASASDFGMRRLGNKFTPARCRVL